MPDFIAVIPQLLRGGLGNLAAYLAAHVLLCLLPAFFIAGAMTALIPKEAITRFLGRSTPKAVSYPAAAAAGSVLAVCSCTIVPIFAGIYRKGAGLGPAITFLFFAPAANILALVYTGGILGPDLAFARFALSLAFGIGIGLIMAVMFYTDDFNHDRDTDALFAGQPAAGSVSSALTFLGAWVLLLLAGTLKLGFLTDAHFEFTVTAPWAESMQAVLDRLVPFDGAKGEEGVSVQGVGLVLLLTAIGLAAWRGLERIHDGFGRWTWIALALIAATLLFAALAVRATPQGLAIGVTGRFIGVLAALSLIAAVGRATLDAEELRDWLWESWRFVKQIFPLLVVGVFLVGVARGLIRPEWIQAVAGANTLAGNAAGVAFGVFMYFPTLVEVPIARMFLDLGMHRGPLLAYLMADPELSLQSILIVSAVIGRLKTLAYVGLVAVFSTAAGLAYGAWIDGANPYAIALGVLALLALLAVILRALSHRQIHAHA
ncbi:MAG: permease [Betaproteobacteria bacterium RIFCSPLOWO2_12_FULL_67_28]|nr:MAG: permease [Betaproteobacteria bacterium RIFCSPLOWO2_12_FULL_67_28]